MRHRARHSRGLYAVAGAVLLAAGMIALVIALLAQQSPPQPPPSAASFVPVSPSSAPHTSPSSAPHTRAAKPPPTRPIRGPSPTVVGPTLARSTPVRLEIPAIGVDSPLQQLGLNPDGTVEVPPLGCHSHAGWYKYSPTPGQLGPSVILGHIDSAACGAGVFFNLGTLRQGDTVSVTLADRQVAVFTIEQVVEYKKTRFPTLKVYGNTDDAALRLITCGGTFDPSEGSYESNIVAYAALTSAHRA